MWRDGVMHTSPVTEPHGPLQSLVNHVAARAQGPEGRQLAGRIALPTQTGKGTPDLGALLARRDGDGRPAIRIQERLAKAAPGDPLAALSLLAMLRPELEAVRDRILHGGRMTSLEAETDTLAAAWEVVTRRPPPRRWERSDAIWASARRVSGLRRGCSVDAEPLPADLEIGSGEHVVPETVVGGSPALLAAAVAAGVLSPRHVVLIARTRIEGVPLAQVAQALGRPYDAVRMERRRAEAALRTFVRRYESEEGS
jgi:DNA-directed RNA polymerase specialized sigma24 family protein